MAELRRIRTHVDLAMTDDARAADDPRSLLRLDTASQTDVVRDDIDMDALDRLLQEMMEEHDRYDPSMDGAIVRDLHRLLPLFRREAADKHLWAWLGRVRYPHFVAWRWKPVSGSGLRSPDRFQGNRVRQAFARLWWAAELTVEDDRDYSLTQKLFGLSGFQDVYEAIFGRAFCQYRPAMAAFVEVVGAEPEKVVRETAKEFGYILTTLVLEAMEEAELKGLLSELVRKVGARLKSSDAAGGI